MFWTKKPQPNPPSPREEFRNRVNDAISAAVTARCDRRRLADFLEDAATRLRSADATLRPLF
jgi:hypothetical protein